MSAFTGLGEEKNAAEANMRYNLTAQLQLFFSPSNSTLSDIEDATVHRLVPHRSVSPASYLRGTLDLTLEDTGDLL